MDLKEILNRLDNVAFFETHGLRVVKRNQRKNWECECPFCGDQKHFSFNPDKGLWRCFKCEESGNAVSFYAKLRGCNNGQAIKAIKEFMGIEDDWEPENSKRNQELKVVSAPTKPTKKVDKPVNPDKHPYHRLIELVHLTDEHRQELKVKRGFADQTIDTFMFRSGGEYIIDVVEQLKKEYPLEDLVETGILKEINGTYLIENQLTDGRILIPYIDEDGKIYHLRPHKLGFEGIPIQPYCKFLLKDKPAKIVLTEGEFKANALWQWGIPGLAIPGISSFGGNNFDRLVDLLKLYEVKEIVVIFDSETKDNPAYPNFKEKIEDRYDTQYWSYMMAYKLNKEGFRTSVGWLPPEWRDNGKIDFDGALAKGKTKADIEKVIAKAKSYKEFLASLDEDGQRVVKRKIAKHFTKLNIRREFNKYVTTVYPPGKGEPYEKTISNFVINIVANFYAGDTIVRNVELVNEYGEKSDIIPMEPGAMAGVNEFKKFVLSKGNYIFEGTATDLVNIWKYEFLNNTGELIYMPEQIGWIDRHNLWLFGNMAIKDGKVYKPDNDGIIWVNGKGFKPQSLSINASGATTEDAIPSLCETEVDIKDIAYKLKQSIGGYEAYMGIGWVVATIFSKDIFAKYKCMPILFPHGKRESGKSTFMRWLMAFFGIETEGISVGKTTTQNYIARALAYWSCLGTWFDEYRNEAGVIEKDGLFRSAYNRQLSGKGTATAFQAKGFAVHSSIAISGEELPKDNGLFTRCIPLQISSYKRDRTWYEWINKNSEYFSGFVYHLIVNYDRYRQKILNNIAELKQALVERGITDRTAENWAICAASFESTVLEDDNFIVWVEKTCQEIKRTGEEEHMLNQFWSDVNFLISKGELGQRHFKYENNKLFVWLQGIYDEWSLHFRKKTGREPFDQMSIIKYLQDEPYYCESTQKRIGSVKRRVHVLDVEKCPETIQEIVAVIENQSSYNA